MDALDTVTPDVFLSAGIEAIYAGVDWISCTLPYGSPDENVWHLLGVHIINLIAKEGYDLETYTRNGYDGIGAGGSFFGVRNDGAYLQLSGHRAGEFLDDIHRDDLHISRLDLQTTVRYRIYAPSVGKEVYKQCSDANGALQKSRQRKIWYLTGNDGGWSTYIGSPKSEQRAVLYNKGVESADPQYERCWRWECRAKNEYATAWYRSVQAGITGRAMRCASIVASWFGLRGAPPVWSAYVPLITMPLIKEVPSDAERRLFWLEHQVRPAIRWLNEHSFGSEAVSALGYTAATDEQGMEYIPGRREGNDAEL